MGEARQATGLVRRQPLGALMYVSSICLVRSSLPSLLALQPVTMLCHLHHTCRDHSNGRSSLIMHIFFMLHLLIAFLVFSIAILLTLLLIAILSLALTLASRSHIVLLLFVLLIL